ncbi:predicted protein [Phaeodactylum tricornutum CCAP 1055/1]|uniref:Zinc transporter ZupT n=2 Tax=Phaeodactylum tricornutum TaxID=2850 RepID=B7G5W8_PHATC|nr:predicted protein [Phaeodactylum tricornutum CCAP 1055/1]EEC45905.1 predicted protein [Phaeodactylum tricornutum CCAP 1055/1]|eukprot:XP_002182618.1 predicted protein [Phaeodactylum tricornutum CCAP 1055/1]
MSEGSVNSENVGVAFGLVIGAGAATSLGAGVVFVPALVKLASRRTLAAALGLSAGVMVYVSLVEIFNEANRHFEEAGFPTDEAYLYATISFFSGVIVMVHEPEAGCSVSDHEDFPAQKDECVVQGKDQKKLLRMSINTALAIGIHNFPEGLATFVATLDNPRVGAILAVAIAIHNIPEGLCIAMPIYYATGNRWRAFGWAMVSGMSEPLAALLGWAVLASCFTQTMFGALFGVVSGMMVIVSVRELLPTAHRYDPDDVVVTYSFMAGMLVMAVSLVLFLV